MCDHKECKETATFLGEFCKDVNDTMPNQKTLRGADIFDRIMTIKSAIESIGLWHFELKNTEELAKCILGLLVGYEMPIALTHPDQSAVLVLADTIKAVERMKAKHSELFHIPEPATAQEGYQALCEIAKCINPGDDDKTLLVMGLAQLGLSMKQACGMPTKASNRQALIDQNVFYN